MYVHYHNPAVTILCILAEQVNAESASRNGSVFLSFALTLVKKATFVCLNCALCTNFTVKKSKHALVIQHPMLTRVNDSPHYTWQIKGTHAAFCLEMTAWQRNKGEGEEKKKKRKKTRLRKTLIL